MINYFSGPHFNFERSEKSCISLPPIYARHPERREGPCISQVRIPKLRDERHAVKREAAVYFDSTSLEGALSEASDYRPAFAGRQATDYRLTSPSVAAAV